MGFFTVMITEESNLAQKVVSQNDLAPGRSNGEAIPFRRQFNIGGLRRQ